MGESPLGDDRRRSRCRSLQSALRGERLEPRSNDLDGVSSGAVGGLPQPALEPTFDVDEAALAKVAGGEVSELAPGDTRRGTLWSRSPERWRCGRILPELNGQRRSEHHANERVLPREDAGLSDRVRGRMPRKVIGDRITACWPEVSEPQNERTQNDVLNGNS